MRRLLPFVLAMSLTVAACADDRDSGDGPAAVGPATSSTTVPGGDRDVEAAGGPAPTPSTTAAPATVGPDDDGRATSTVPAGRTPTTSAPSAATEPAPASAAAEPTPADDGRLGPPGAYARTLLRPRPATSVVVEQFHQRGAEPADQTVSRVDATLRQVTQKDVQVRAPVVLDGSGEDWTADRLRDLAERSSQVPAPLGGAVASLKVLFVGGSFQGDGSILGVAVRGDVIAVFGESIGAARTPIVSRGVLEEAVVIHELGHVLGLVDLARDTGRADPEHPGHSPNSRSVMYWAVESSLIGQVLTGPPPREFDDADLADLAALRAGA